MPIFALKFCKNWKSTYDHISYVILSLNPKNKEKILYWHAFISILAFSWLRVSRHLKTWSGHKMEIQKFLWQKNKYKYNLLAETTVLYRHKHNIYINAKFQKKINQRISRYFWTNERTNRRTRERARAKFRVRKNFI